MGWKGASGQMPRGVKGGLGAQRLEDGGWGEPHDMAPRGYGLEVERVGERSASGHDSSRLGDSGYSSLRSGAGGWVH
uniref:Uncharacterized protein n=1 Tax=Solanum lycopersicum TaxID=4081 RepID=A0A3Q7HSR3_SOLLC